MKIPDSLPVFWCALCELSTVFCFLPKAVELGSMSSTPHFSVINGSDVFDNGHVRIWRCPHCQCWRPWVEETCSLCHFSREALSKDADGNSGKKQCRGNGVYLNGAALAFGLCLNECDQ